MNLNALYEIQLFITGYILLVVQGETRFQPPSPEDILASPSHPLQIASSFPAYPEKAPLSGAQT